MSDDLDWSDRIRLDQIGAGITRHLEADAAARARIARALDLAELLSLTADLTLQPAGAGWRLKGVIHADVVQTCGVTLEPLSSKVASDLSIDLIEGHEDVDLDVTVDADPDGPDGPDVVTDGGVDLAGYVVEHLALALDPWPRKPGAEFVAPDGPEEPSPFAVLKDLKPRS